MWEYLVLIWRAILCAFPHSVCVKIVHSPKTTLAHKEGQPTSSYPSVIILYSAPWYFLYDSFQAVHEHLCSAPSCRISLSWWSQGSEALIFSCQSILRCPQKFRPQVLYRFCDVVQGWSSKVVDGMVSAAMAPQHVRCVSLVVQCMPECLGFKHSLTWYIVVIWWNKQHFLFADRLMWDVHCLRYCSSKACTWIYCSTVYNVSCFTFCACRL